MQALSEEAFRGIESRFSARADRSVEQWAPAAVEAGAVVIDNTSAFRLDPDVPLVVPEVNPDAALQHQGIIANPNCSTIIMLVALNPLHREAGIERIVVSTYQAVSGAGAAAMERAAATSARTISRDGRLPARLLPVASGEPTLSDFVQRHPASGHVRRGRLHQRRVEDGAGNAKSVGR